MSNYNKTILFILLGLLFSCNNPKPKDDDMVLARVHDIYLYESDLKGVVPSNSSANDSLMIVKSFINNWIRKQLVIRQAETNLTDEEKNFSKQIETYRNSLIIYKYESLLISQKLDTIISDNEIEQYYNNHSANFQLKNNIVKVEYVKLNADSPYSKRIKNLIQKKGTNLVLMDSLQYYCETQAIDFLIESNRWVNFNDLLNLIPINTYNQETFLQNNTFFELVDESYQYYVNFLDFSIKNEVSPLDFEKENIKRLILNRRKSELLNKMRKDIFEQALNNKSIEIF